MEKNKKICNTCNFKCDWCICEPGWEYFDQYLEDYYKSPNKGDNILSPLFISTMTVNTKIPFMDMDYEKIINEFKRSIFFNNIRKGGIGKKKKNNDSSAKTNNYNLTNNTLYLSSYIPYKNPLDLDSEYYTRTTCQIFKTGSFTITGLKSIKQATYHLQTLFKWIVNNKYYIPREYEEILNARSIEIKFRKDTNEITIKNPKMILIDRSTGLNKIISVMVLDKKEEWYLNIKSVNIEGGTSQRKMPNDPFRFIGTKISMLNMDFKLTVDIKQDVLSNILNNPYYSIWNETRDGLKDPEQRGPLSVVSFQRDDDCRAISITYVPQSKKVVYNRRLRVFPRQISIKGHNAGSFVMCGTKRIEDAFEVYNFIVPLIEQYKKEVTSFPQKRNKTIRKVYKLETIVKELEEDISK